MLPEDFTLSLPSISQNWKGFADNALIIRNREEESGWFDRAILAKGADRPLQFSKFINTLDSSKKPSFNFLHIMLPHTPHKYLPSGKRYNSVSFPGVLQGDREEWSSDKWAVLPYYQRYLLQVGFVDKLLGKLIEKLRSTGMYDRSLLIITADHGVSFRSGDLRRPVSETNYHDIMAVPLFIKLPQQREGSIIDRNIETIDILPTITGTLNITVPWGMDGRSAFDTSLPERTEKIIYYNQARRKKKVHTELFEKDKYLSLDRKLSIFGSWLETDGILKVGPNSELIGSTLRELHVEETADIHIQLQDAHLFHNVDQKSSFVPVHIAGNILPHQDTPLNLAVSVNGFIAAVARTFHNGKKDSTIFSAIVPESVLKKGNNKINVFVVSGSTEQLQLSRTKS